MRDASTPKPSSVPSPVITAAGDIADCTNDGDEATARLLAGTSGTLITLGDNAYPAGTETNFENCYDPTWGQFKDRTKPVPGNHEYRTEEARGYFSYFGEAAGDQGKGYYSYTRGDWHIVALNSSCEKIGGCSVEQPQAEWLKKDLAAHKDKKCTLAYFHEPLFSAGEKRPGIFKVKSLWKILYNSGADIILSGHDHNYQRFAPQDPEGKADSERGIRQFVVGTGGKKLYEIESPIANLEVYNDENYGILKLNLYSERYEWRFVPVAGEKFTDSGSTRCH